ncbi:hypothetical protein BLNAU_19959 [Blattamonas nauphoetae]|uniref:Protein kinase domain-containing protein n=1 Tax=Blattamonas nauphoetae TaxID=2049346 RepID=A0ABQ9X029_9EUKA|nr:hypothetical protein BLNAU_19959 [Blattamonas nauphoetae]
MKNLRVAKIGSAPILNRAIDMKGGTLKLHGTIFTMNNPDDSSFPSFRRNIRCSEGGKIEVGSLSEGDGSSDKHPHLWLSHEDCVLSGEDVNVNAPFFIPTLLSSSTSKLNKADKTFMLTMDGTTLIPCSLMLEVFEKKKDGTEGQMSQFPLTLDTTSSFTEDRIELTLALSSLSSFDAALEWNGRLIFGNDLKTSSFTIQRNSRDRLAESMKNSMKWWIPLLVSLVCLLVLTLVVLVICWRRKNQKNQKRDEEAPQELTTIDEKMEIEYEERVTMEVSSVPAKTRMDEATRKEKELEENSHTKNLIIVSPEVVECLNCGDGFAMCFVSRKTTLFRQLHQEKRPLLNRRQHEIRLVRGLDQLARMGTYSQMLRHVTSHRILLGKDGSLNVNLEEPEPNGVVRKGEGKGEEKGEGNGCGTAGCSNGMGGQDGMNEAVRWQAPEEGKADVAADVRQVGVFRLGLVLFEMETGSVPFGETDGVNAHRQIEMGMDVGMEKVLNRSMREVISSCLQVDGKMRPSFETVALTLEGIEPDADDRGLPVIS